MRPMAIRTVACVRAPQSPGQRWRRGLLLNRLLLNRLLISRLLLSGLAISLLGSSQLLGRPAQAAPGDTPGGKGAQV